MIFRLTLTTLRKNDLLDAVPSLSFFETRLREDPSTIITSLRKLKDKVFKKILAAILVFKSLVKNYRLSSEYVASEK